MGVKANDQTALQSTQGSAQNNVKSDGQNVTASQNVNLGTHIVRINFLGLAGVTVDKVKCREPGKKKQFPCSPEEMSAVVAVAHQKEMKATTGLSKPLSHSPSQEVVISNNGADDTQSQNTNSSLTQRHIAVWAGNQGSIGSAVSFNANLTKLDHGDSRAYASEYAPKTFELIVALTENSKHENKIAMPIGVANLNVCGDQCPNGETHVLDLPLLTLRQARPLAADTNGLGGFQMIAVRSGKAALKRKKSIKRFFGIQGAGRTQKIPSVEERRIFSSVYSADAAGDAILRIQLQVLERGKHDEFNRASQMSPNMIAPGINFPSNLPKEIPNDPGDESVISSDSSGNSYSLFSIQSRESRTVQTDGSDTLVSDGSGSHAATLLSDEASGTVLSDGTGTLESDAPFDEIKSRKSQGPPEDNSIVSRGPGKAEKRPKRHSDMSEGEDDAYTLSFGRHEDDNETTDLPTFKLFGKVYRLGDCGPMAGYDERTEGEFFDENMTVVTGDFFGEEYHIPICAGLKPDDDSATLESLRLNQTMSTLSENASFKDHKRGQMIKHFKKAQEEYRAQQLRKRRQTTRKQDRVEPKLHIKPRVPEAQPERKHPKDQHRLEQQKRALETSKARNKREQQEVVPPRENKSTDQFSGQRKMGQHQESERSSSKGFAGEEFEYTLQGEVPRDHPNDTPVQVKPRPASKSRVVDRELVDGELDVVVRVSSAERKTDSFSDDSSEIEAVLKAPAGGRRRNSNTVERFSLSLSSMFGCGPGHVDDKIYNSEFPTGVVIQGDNQSVGELTATTYEQKLLSQQVKKHESRVPVPIACGGTGVLMNGRSLGERDASEGKTSDGPDENYFFEYERETRAAS